MYIGARFLNKQVRLWTAQGPLTLDDLADPKFSDALGRYLLNVVVEIAPWLAQTRDRMKVCWGQPVASSVQEPSIQRGELETGPERLDDDESSD